MVPGFVNAHYHSHDVLLKGVFDPMPLQMWFVNALPPQYPMRSAEEVRARTLLGAAECLLAGITTVQDMVTLYPFDDALLDAVLEAYDEIGIRTVLSLQIGDRRAIDRIPHWRELVPGEYHDWLGSADRCRRRKAAPSWWAGRSSGSGLARERFSWALGPTSALMSSPELLAGIAALSDRHGLPVLSHMYESRPEVIASRTHLGAHGGSQIEYMRAAGLLGPRLALAHSIWFTRGGDRRPGRGRRARRAQPGEQHEEQVGRRPDPALPRGRGRDRARLRQLRLLRRAEHVPGDETLLRAGGDQRHRSGHAGRAGGPARGDAGRRGGGRARR